MASIEKNKALSDDDNKALEDAIKDFKATGAY